jgi:hypothetical protein
VRSVTTENVGEILQRLYDSEINVHLGWEWEGGVDYRLRSNGEDVWSKTSESSPKRDVVEAGRELVDEVVARMPTSNFASWWREGALATAEAPSGRR